MSRVWLVLLVCCGVPMSRPTVTPVASSMIAMTELGVGPITAATTATLVGLRQVFVGYDVVPINLDTSEDFPPLEYQVYDGDKKLFEIVPNDEGGILNVHVDTPNVAVTGHPWRVGSPLTSVAELTKCDCWGGKPVCFKKGEHVGVAFERGCRAVSTRKGLRTLEGRPIARLVWSAKGFGDVPTETDGPDLGDP